MDHFEQCRLKLLSLPPFDGTHFPSTSLDQLACGFLPCHPEPQLLLPFTHVVCSGMEAMSPALMGWIEDACKLSRTVQCVVRGVSATSSEPAPTFDKCPGGDHLFADARSGPGKLSSAAFRSRHW